MAAALLMFTIADAQSSISASLSASDRTFLENTAEGAGYEFTLGKLATRKGAGADINSYAEMIVRDHGHLSSALNKQAEARVSS